MTVSSSHIAKWNGHQWSALGMGTSDIVYAVAVSTVTREMFVGAHSLRGPEHITFCSFVRDVQCKMGCQGGPKTLPRTLHKIKEQTHE
jgi:hypothetical protein